MFSAYIQRLHWRLGNRSIIRLKETLTSTADIEVLRSVTEVCFPIQTNNCESQSSI